uniref:COP9 signalosome complex subunit 5 n=1 Tax=Blastobotrys adeninivorans TaxID=409370 RepID=A0A060T5V2_BLAAD
MAQKAFELENDIKLVGEDDKLYYQYNKEEQQKLLRERPWKDDPHYFKRVRISAIALLRMAIHARAGGSIEVMGVMTGKILPNEFVIMDTYPLPVEGTETRVNALGEAYEYMVDYLNSLQAVGRSENIVGWYHSHPGYGCWLSGIDVGTQAQNQQFQDPFLAIVVDPNRTISAGKVDIGAFRTYPEGYKPSKEEQEEIIQGIPFAKMEDFGVHADRYYPLEISYFKSTLDARLLEILWNKYWASTLSQSPLLTNMEYNTNQMKDLVSKIDNVRESVGARKCPDLSSLNGVKSISQLGAAATNKNKSMADVVEESRKIGAEQIRGLVTRELNSRLFEPIESPHRMT